MSRLRPGSRADVAHAEAVANAAADAAAARARNEFAWTLAFVPLILVAVDAATTASASVTATAAIWIGFAVALVLNTILVLADWRLVRHVGVELPAALGLFLVPVYLFLRQARLKSSYAVPIVWCVCFLVAVISGPLIADTAGVKIDIPRLESQIESNELSQAGLTVTVTCPSSVTARPGTSFRCIINASTLGSQAIVKVTVQNSQGDVIWQPG